MVSPVINTFFLRAYAACSWLQIYSPLLISLILYLIKIYLQLAKILLLYVLLVLKSQFTQTVS